MIDVPLDRAREQIGRAQERARRLHRCILATVSLPVGVPPDLAAIVRQANAHDGDAFLWEQPAEEFGMAGLGAAVVVRANGPERFAETIASCDAAMRDAVTDGWAGADGPLFVGGFAFASEAAQEGPWAGFQPGRLVLPHLLVVRRGAAATLTVAWMIDERTDGDALLRRLAADIAHLTPAISMHEPRGNGGAARYQATLALPVTRWKQAVSETLDDIACGRVEKLVLARACLITADRPFDCAAVMRRLRAAYPACTLFWIRAQHADFLGATPESLIRRDGRQVRTAAVAGSAPPGVSAHAAQVLGRALREDAKERAEHAIVVRALADALAPLCERLDIAPGPQVLRLDTVQHLVTPISGTLAQPRHILSLVERLHPSPAVAGHPRETALRLLREREGLDRGWYAGPVGWMDARGNGEFAVAIRSAIVRGTQAALYAGGGIVAGSDPEREVAETRMKLRALLPALMER